MLEIKSTEYVSFSEIFKFAKKQHGIEWNAANDLFFRSELIRYNGYQWFESYKGKLDNSEFCKATLIIEEFMLKHNVTNLLILG